MNCRPRFTWFLLLVLLLELQQGGGYVDERMLEEPNELPLHMHSTYAGSNGNERVRLVFTYIAGTTLLDTKKAVMGKVQRTRLWPSARNTRP
ncbi:hypothetical protein KC19_3G223600 [Ceratodon purpureus]|uniref:Secreted protein n=1 Tax=Ceratodon purpureus TaxID=3225 RepID=A0A8T0ILH1_CERPU|nr:hypothetical protein KC19_3G223600 [Ceratodon purpureus]